LSIDRESPLSRQTNRQAALACEPNEEKGRPKDEERAVNENHEVEFVLEQLEEMVKKVTSPMLRTCLEDARADIVYLLGPTTSDGGLEGPERPLMDELAA
jgi:hypothetical protein